MTVPVPHASDRSVEGQDLSFAQAGMGTTAQEIAEDCLLHLPEELLDWVCRRVPKLDLHCHIEGSISPETVLEIARKYAVDLPAGTVEELRPLVQVTPEDSSLLDFLKKFEIIGKLFVSYDAIKEITQKALENLVRDNLIYLEARFSPFYIANASGLSAEQVANAVIEGCEAARSSTGIPINLIVIAERQMPVERAWEALEIATRHLDDGVVGFDLANDEYNYPPEPFKDVFREAAQRMGTTVHMAEAGKDGRAAQNARVVLEEFVKPDTSQSKFCPRGGHGTRMYEDPEVEELARKKQFPIEACITSNIDTGAAASFEEHPFPRYFRNGLKIFPNTDDPAISGITLTNEYKLAVQLTGLSLTDVEQLVRNAIESCFLPEEKREQLQRHADAEFLLLRQELSDKITGDPRLRQNPLLMRYILE